MSRVERPVPSSDELQAYAYDALSDHGRIAELHEIVTLAEKSPARAIEELSRFFGAIAMAGYELGHEAGVEAAGRVGYRIDEGDDK